MYQYAAGLVRLMLVIKLWRWPQGVPHPAIFSRQHAPLCMHTHTYAETRLLVTCISHTRADGHTHTCKHTCLTQSQPVDDNLVEGLRKCFISQLPLLDKARVPTVRKGWGVKCDQLPPIPSQDRLVCLIYPQTDWPNTPESPSTSGCVRTEVKQCCCSKRDADVDGRRIQTA